MSPPAEEPAKSLDVTKLDLPSDKITVGTLRKRDPRVFADYHTMMDTSIADISIGAVIATELVLARNAFLQASGIVSEDVIDPVQRREEIMNLNVDYCEHGISSGIRQTNELVRQLEHQATQQARGTGR